MIWDVIIKWWCFMKTCLNHQAPYGASVTHLRLHWCSAQLSVVPTVNPHWSQGLCVSSQMQQWMVSWDLQRIALCHTLCLSKQSQAVCMRFNYVKHPHYLENNVDVFPNSLGKLAASMASLLCTTYGLGLYWHALCIELVSEQHCIFVPHSSQQTRNKYSHKFPLPSLPHMQGWQRKCTT